MPLRIIPSAGMDRETYDKLLIDELLTHEVELVCLAGFMRLLSADFIRAFPNRVLNIHPSLLPAFAGLDAQRQALEYGVRITGCTVHFVDEYLDSGPIIIQSAVPVLDTDTVETLSARILLQEHVIYPKAIGYIVDGRLTLQGRTGDDQGRRLIGREYEPSDGTNTGLHRTARGAYSTPIGTCLSGPHASANSGGF